MTRKHQNVRRGIHALDIPPRAQPNHVRRKRSRTTSSTGHQQLNSGPAGRFDGDRKALTSKVMSDERRHRTVVQRKLCTRFRPKLFSGPGESGVVDAVRDDLHRMGGYSVVVVQLTGHP